MFQKLPENTDYWNFDCSYGSSGKEAKTIHVSEIKKYMDEAESLKLKSFYLEILAKVGQRREKEHSDSQTQT